MIYWGEEEENEVLNYQNGNELEQKRSFEKLSPKIHLIIDGIIEKYNYDFVFKDIKNKKYNCFIHLSSLLSKCDSSRGKSFSFLTSCGLHWFYWAKRKQKKKNIEFSSLDNIQYLMNENFLSLDELDKYLKSHLKEQHYLCFKYIKQYCENARTFCKRDCFEYIRSNVDINTKQITNIILKYIKPSMERFYKI